MIKIAHPQVGKEEEAAIQRVLASGQLAQGNSVALFEQRFAHLCQVKEAIAVSSGTSALHLALLAHNIGEGDEVITTAFSFAATANAILLTGATPVFVDIEPDTYTLDPARVERAITSRTRAILPVHLYGHPCNMEALQRLAADASITLIEDAAQAHAASIYNRAVGSFGTGCFSFYATKNMTTGEGGMITTNNPAIAERARLLRNHGQQGRYHHIMLGYNQRMTEIQAAIGLAQLDKLASFTQQRIANAEFLNRKLQGHVPIPVTRPGYRHVYHQYTIRIPDQRDAIAAHLYEQGIETAIHYPTPIHQQPYYKELITYVTLPHLPVTEKAAQQVLSLPVHPALSEEDLSLIARKVIEICH